ncbi:MAG TPA: cytochrome c biogenesis protein CcsA [Acidimicrobiales bacterium]|nr:cytochrome c biogenesis protein CcsA [Acidimicrobiales bacterium]
MTPTTSSTTSSASSTSAARPEPPGPTGPARGPAAGGASPTSPAPPHTGSRGTRVLGGAALASLALLVLYGLVVSPADAEMADSVRLMYVHVPAATFMYAGCVIATVASAFWLRRRTPGWDALAGAGAEIGLVFAAITLGTGSLWGRPTWGTYWTWDARLTSTALLAAMLLGYLALRRLDVDPGARSSRAAVLGLLLLPNAIVVNRSVEWWRSLHQQSTLVRLDPTIEGDMLVALMLGFLAIGLVFCWLLVHRFRLGWLEHQSERLDLDAALAARRAEAVPPAEGT